MLDKEVPKAAMNPAQLQAEVKRLSAALAVTEKDLTSALKDRDYNGSKWRLYEMECNRLGSPISHNQLTKDDLEFLVAFHKRNPA